jgi:hypothetical protein
MIVKGNEFYYAIYDEENDSYGEPKKLNAHEVGISEIKLKNVENVDLGLTVDGYEVELKDHNIRTLSPVLRRYFKLVRMNGFLYI